VIKHTLALSLLFLLPSHAKDIGQWGSNVSPELRAWFNGVYNRKGIKCCEAADGYPVEYQMRSDNHYWVRFKGSGTRSLMKRWCANTATRPVAAWSGSPKYLVGGPSTASCRSQSTDHRR
jgi:hypothetical protein